ncbi:hypothetical protein QR685DRAFT_568306 [Neurospora intermedia]|uniref:Protein YAE1 n=1 Tax=Neurospora intermedia TaxID=5142 RepID=A0ABR3DS91_NEUIN
MSSSGRIANNADAGVAPTAPAVEYHNPTDDTTLSIADNSNTTLDDVWGNDGDDNDDDVWGDDSHSHSHSHEDHHHHHEATVRGHGGHNHPSDIPRLQQEHTTAGYRDGITVAKAEHVQAGFDEGFGLGATIGAMAGQLLGVLEGLSFSLGSSSSLSAKGRNKPPQQEDGEGEGGEEEDIKERVKRLLAEAEKDLSVHSIYGKEYWDEDGTWKFEVPGETEEQHERYQHPEREQPQQQLQQQQRQQQRDQEDMEEEDQKREEKEEAEPEILFPDIALAHPLIKKWDQIIRTELAGRFGLVWDVAVLLPRSEEDEHEEGHEHGHVVKGSEEQKDAKPVKATSQALAW